MKKVLIILLVSIVPLLAVAVMYLKSKQEAKPEVVSLREQYQEQLRNGVTPQIDHITQEKKENSENAGNMNNLLSDKAETDEKRSEFDVVEDNKQFANNENEAFDKKQQEAQLFEQLPDDLDIEVVNNDSNSLIDKVLSGLSDTIVSAGSKYHYSSNLYFDVTNKKYDESAKKTMRWLNNAADEIEKAGCKQPPINYNVLNDPKAELLSDNTYVSPGQLFYFNGLYQITSMSIPYYVTPDSSYPGMGSNKWELVLNKFMEAMFSYLSVKEAKKYVDIDFAYKAAEPGEDVSKHTVYTDLAIAKIIGMGSTIYKAHPEAVICTATYVLKNAMQIGDIVVATVYPVFSWYTYEKVDNRKDLDPNNVYMTEYLTDDNTGELYELMMYGEKKVFFLSMAKDDYGDWKIVCIEPFQ
ncbi:MAG: hypothetical protein K6E85_01925 [Lachnospiraceae bacterium]|nr:hypothetical protein [Lachnospiraceae bacterium]